MRSAVLIAIALVAASCRGEEHRDSFRVATGGDADRGHDVIAEHGCAACHDIPGVRAPGGLVGPPLGGFARRTFIAGELPNTPENLVRWIQHPHRIEPHTAMPELGLTEKEARDVAAYLSTLD